MVGRTQGNGTHNSSCQKRAEGGNLGSNIITFRSRSFAALENEEKIAVQSIKDSLSELEGSCQGICHKLKNVHQRGDRRNVKTT